MKKRAIDFKYNLKLYWSLLRRYKWLFIILLLVIVIIESSHLVDKLLFKVIVDRGGEFTAGSLARSSFVEILLLLVTVFVVVGVVKICLKWCHLHLLNRLESSLVFDLKRKFFNHILHLSYDFHTTHRTGSLISRLVRGGRAIEALTDVIVFNLLPLMLQTVVVVGSLLYFSWQPAVVVLLTAVVFLGYSFWIQQKQRHANITVNDCEDLEKAQISDYFTNIDSVKYFGKEDNIKSRFLRYANLTRQAMLKHWNYYRWMDSGHGLILSAGLFFLIYFPLRSFLDGDLSLGTLVFVFTIYGNMYYPLFSFVHGLRNFYHSMADFESLFQYYKVHNEIKDTPKASSLQIKEGSIEFKDVDFSYKKRMIFKNFNLKIPHNHKIALVGHSGCGKTTLIRVLYRLYDVKRGEVLIDGRNIRSVKQESLRSELSIVPQECILFDDSIFNNIAFSKPGASRKEVMNAMKFAQLDKLVATFPKQDRTIVGERGVKLSGGEKQRVSIARAILADKKILVLDEATSSLDSETEHEIQKDLQKLMRGRTSIIIAHRLSTIMQADTIVVMKKGRIVQMGSHKELTKQKGEYKKLWDLQKGGFIK